MSQVRTRSVDESTYQSTRPNVSKEINWNPWLFYAKRCKKKNNEIRRINCSQLCDEKTYNFCQKGGLKGNAAEKTNVEDYGLTIKKSGCGTSDRSREGEGSICIKQKKKEDDEEEEDFVCLVF